MNNARDHRIAVYGRSGSGKGTVATILTDRYGYMHVSSGSVCRSISQILFGDEDRAHLNALSTALRSIDEHLLIEAALRAIKTDIPIVFDSIRYKTDYDWFRESGFSLWKVDCPEEICIRRLKSRGQVFSVKDLDHLSESGLEHEEFDFTIDNSGSSLKELEHTIASRLSAV